LCLHSSGGFFVAKSLIVIVSRGGAPGSVARGTREAGSGSGGDAAIVLWIDEAYIPLQRSHLPAEDTAPPSAVAPFASSPFAHPIPQSHCRAYRDLFRDSQAACSFRIGVSRLPSGFMAI